MAFMFLPRRFLRPFRARRGGRIPGFKNPGLNPIARFGTKRKAFCRLRSELDNEYEITRYLNVMYVLLAMVFCHESGNGT